MRETQHETMQILEKEILLHRVHMYYLYVSKNEIRGDQC